MATDSDNWAPDAADWLSESVESGLLTDDGTGAAWRRPGVDVERGPQPAVATAAPRVFDDPLDDPAPAPAIPGSPAAQVALAAPTVSDAIVPQTATPATDQTSKGRKSRKERKAAAGSPGPTPRRPGPGASGTGQRAENAPRRRRRRRRMRILPRSVLGISMMILAAGLGAAVSGTILFMRYEYRRDLSDAYIKGFDQRVKLSTDAVIAEGQNAQARIQTELEPLLKQAATGETLIRILSQAKGSIMTVQTFSDAGVPVVGTAFVAASDAEKSFLITSYSVVKASVVKPGPAITVRIDGTDTAATLWTWQEERDLALLIVNKGGLPRLEWAAATDTKMGSQVFAISALGTDGGAVTSGFVADVSSSGIQHYAPVGTAFQGGPIVNDRGRVVAVGSQTYAPLGFPSTGVWFAPSIRAACEQLLKCPSGVVTGAGTQR